MDSLLEEQFRKEFKFNSNISLEITFQWLHVDEDWGKIYIDLDGDSTLKHKDKLKAVVAPVLTTPKNSSEVSELVSAYYYHLYPPFVPPTPPHPTHHLSQAKFLRPARIKFYFSHEQSRAN